MFSSGTLQPIRRGINHSLLLKPHVSMHMLPHPFSSLRMHACSRHMGHHITHQSSCLCARPCPHPHALPSVHACMHDQDHACMLMAMHIPITYACVTLACTQPYPCMHAHDNCTCSYMHACELMVLRVLVLALDLVPIRMSAHGVTLALAHTPTHPYSCMHVHGHACEYAHSHTYPCTCSTLMGMRVRHTHACTHTCTCTRPLCVFKA